MGERQRYAPGTFCWAELGTDDPEGATAFYVDLFGWEAVDMALGGGGMMPLSPHAGRSHWLVYVTSVDLDTAVQIVEDLGGQVMVPPMPIPSGRVAVATDPHGATFAMFEGRVDP